MALATVGLAAVLEETTHTNPAATHTLLHRPLPVVKQQAMEEEAQAMEAQASAAVLLVQQVRVPGALATAEAELVSVPEVPVLAALDTDLRKRLLTQHRVEAI